jgi:predicted nucleic acid-binding protein
VTLFVDSSALVQRYVDEPDRDLVLEAMAGDDVWCASALCRSEVLLVLHRIAATPRQAGRLTAMLHADWDAFAVVPVDERCLAAAADIGANYGLKVVDAVHLAAATRLPRPVRYLTLDARQVSAAVALELEVVTSSP